MNEVEYYAMQEDAAIGGFIRECVDEILSQHCATTLGQLQRNAYKYTDAGVCVSFLLADGSALYVGDERAYDPAMIAHVIDIGVSSIVEGSDAEVPLQWIGLTDYEQFETPAAAADAYGKLLDVIDAEASALWHEANDNNGFDEDEDEGDWI